MLADAASSGFADGMSTAFIIGAAALALGAVIVALFLPARARDHEPAPVGAAGDGQRTGTPAVAAGDRHRPVAPAAPAVPADTLGWEPTDRVTGAPPVPTAAPDPEPR